MTGPVDLTGPIRLATPPEPPGQVWTWLWGLLIALGVAGGVLGVRALRRRLEPPGRRAERALSERLRLTPEERRGVAELARASGVPPIALMLSAAACAAALRTAAGSISAGRRRHAAKLAQDLHPRLRPPAGR